jgi:hypothetical protein
VILEKHQNCSLYSKGSNFGMMRYTCFNVCWNPIYSIYDESWVIN